MAHMSGRAKSGAWHIVGRGFVLDGELLVAGQPVHVFDVGHVDNLLAAGYLREPANEEEEAAIKVAADRVRKAKSGSLAKGEKPTVQGAPSEEAREDPAAEAEAPVEIASEHG